MWFDIVDPLDADFSFFNELNWLRSNLENWASSKLARDLRADTGGRFPLINVGETDQEFKVYVFAPGMDQKDLEVRIQNNLLTIQGKRETLTEKDLKEATIYRQERFSGEFVKTLSLPDSVNSESIEARVKNGIVTITLPKKAALQPKRIEVRAA